jgi:hypothetical protein
MNDSKPQTMQIYDTNFSQKCDHFHGPIWEMTHIYRNAPIHYDTRQSLISGNTWKCCLKIDISWSSVTSVLLLWNDSKSKVSIIFSNTEFKEKVLKNPFTKRGRQPCRKITTTSAICLIYTGQLGCARSNSKQLSSGDDSIHTRLRHMNHTHNSSAGELVSRWNQIFCTVKKIFDPC